MGSKESYPAIAKQLAAHVSGEVRFDDMMRVLYSTDASHYQVYPIGVVLPKTNEDIAAAVQICAEHHLPIVPRGGGSGLCGASIGPGVVIDPTKYMTRVLDVDVASGAARVQAGAVLGVVNKQLAKLGWQFGPDPASAERAAIGGIIGTNATGAHSIRYGMTSDNILAMGCVLADGSMVELGAETTDDGRPTTGASAPLSLRSSVVRRLSSSIKQIAADHARAIRECFPKVWRRASGYNLDYMAEMLAFDPAQPTACLTQGNAMRQTFNLQNHVRQISQFNLAPLIVGSEGTLAVVVEATLNLVPKPKQTALVIVQFDRLLDAMRAVPVLLHTDPDAIELIGDTFVKLARDLPEYRDKMHWLDLTRGVPEAALVMEFAGGEAAEIAESVARAVALINNEHVPCTTRVLTDPAAQADVWAVRKGGLAILQSIRSEFKPISVVEDVAVPVQHLADFVEDLLAIFAEFGANGAIYGHASAGCLHVRPLVNMKTVEGMATVHGIAERALALTLRYSGAMSGEHGDGYERTRHNAELFGDEVYQAFCDVKKAFDPQGILNPNKKVHGLDLDESMRFGPGYKTFAFPSTFTFQKDGSLGALAERCNGQGVCRKQDSGVMCPSYRVTMDEAHNTRGRANLLQELLSNRGKWAEETMDDRRPTTGGSDGRRSSVVGRPVITQNDVMASLDLCLSCKACETECASGVDMAKMKSDFTQQVYDEHGVPMRAWALGRIAMLSGLASAAPKIANGFMKQRWFKRLIGVAEGRDLPVFARETFMTWWGRGKRRRDSEAGTTDDRRREDQTVVGRPSSRLPSRVVLFVDTFTRYNHPEIGIAAVTVLEKLGYEVIVPEWQCCGRPLISQGQPRAARELAEFNLSILAPLARQGLPILGLEPSCISALKDDYLDLVPGEDAQVVAKAVLSIEEFIISDLSAFMADATQMGRTQMKDETSKILFHGHCHQKAVWSTKGSKQALTQAGFGVKEIESTCCGMAGAFGFEAEHDALSRQIGELALLPAVRAASEDTRIVAPGTSCRQQIEGLTGRKALHPIEVIAQRLAELAARQTPV